MLAPLLAIADAGRALGSAVAQPTLPQVSGSGVVIGSVGQFPVPHKLNALPRSVIRITESVLSAVLASFSRALVGRTQPTLLHSAVTTSVPTAQPVFWHPWFACSRRRVRER